MQNFYNFNDLIDAIAEMKKQNIDRNIFMSCWEKSFNKSIIDFQKEFLKEFIKNIPNNYSGSYFW